MRLVWPNSSSTYQTTGTTVREFDKAALGLDHPRIHPYHSTFVGQPVPYPDPARPAYAPSHVQSNMDNVSCDPACSHVDARNHSAGHLSFQVGAML